ncbi:helix-turn-helix domain-containing protein [Aureibaculum luteum]|uniref:helix-turn-helix domain-containing protein n=1 Tax=Aureibaculum luteum TaxID=1548456 RepID=UPI000E5245C6|nr:helix-turn-helix domain-containing protein [Aureibaculum luteum]
MRILVELGKCYGYLGQFEKAMTYYDESTAIAEKHNLEFYKQYVIPTRIAYLHLGSGNYKKGLITNKNLLKVIESIDSVNEDWKKNRRSALAVNISRIYIALKEKDSALWILEEGVKKNMDTINLNAKLRYKAQLGFVYLEKKEYNKALLYLKEAERVGYEYDPSTGPANVSLQLGECYLNLKKYDKAITTLVEGIEVKIKKQSEMFLVNDYKLLAKVYKEAGNIEKSNEYYEKFILNLTTLEKGKDTLVSTFHDKEMQELKEVEASKKNRLQYIIGSILIFVLGLIFIIGYLIKEKKKNTEKFNVLLAKFNQEEKATFEIIDTKDKVLEEKVSAEVNEETTHLILAGLQTLKEQEYFLRQDCNSYTIAKKIKTNTTYLSKVINSHYEKNFNTYINDLRINYAVLRLKNDNRFRSFSVQSIAEEIGYKSADSFAKYFKLRTGLNPSFYIKQLNSLS